MLIIKNVYHLIYNEKDNDGEGERRFIEKGKGNGNKFEQIFRI